MPVSDKFVKLVGVGIAGVIVLGVLGLAGHDLFERFELANQPHWTIDLVKQYDSDYIGKMGYVYFPLVCGATLMAGNITPNSIVYAYSKFNVDLKTGQWKMLEFSGPKDTSFKCPAQPKVSSAPTLPNTPQSQPKAK
jgi:hypothetical protein